MEEKIYTFRHQKVIYALPNEFPLKVLEDKLVLDLISKGYLPSKVRSGYEKRLRPDRIKLEEYDYATCYCAYVGKKQAPILWESNKKELN